MSPDKYESPSSSQFWTKGPRILFFIGQHIYTMDAQGKEKKLLRNERRRAKRALETEEQKGQIE